MAISTRDTTQSSAIAYGLATGLIAAGMLVYAALYAEAAWRFAQVEPRYREVERGRLGSVVEFDALTQALRASPRRADLSRAAFVQMLAAQQLDLGSVRAVSRLASARRDLRRGVAAAPTDAFAWMRLAITETHLNAPRRAAAALVMALHVAPADSKLVGLQFDLAIVLWPQLDVAAKRLLERRLDWAEQRPGLKSAVVGNSAQAMRRRLRDERNEP